MGKHSTRTTNNTEKVQAISCGWCKNAGKTKAEYSTHLVIACPVLAAHKCGDCNELGHTRKRCPQAAAKKREMRAARSRPRAQIFTEDGTAIIGGKFASRAGTSNAGTGKAGTGKAGKAKRKESVNPFDMEIKSMSISVLNKRRDDWFQCEVCNIFQHSCCEVVEEHEKECNDFDSIIVAGEKFSWADECDSDQDQDEADQDEDEAGQAISNIMSCYNASYPSLH